ncbi:MAG: BamA/TamA family outer membrane protein [bacterium]|nr:BamA/TamA family outer membrane protein [bacterium]
MALYANEKNFIRANGTLQLTGSGSIDAAVNGRIASEILNAYLQDAAFSGTNRLHFQVKGNLGSPEFTGEVVLENGGMQYPEQKLYLSGLKGTLRLADGNLITPAPITGGINGGTVEITRGTGWDIGFQKVKLDVPAGLLSEAGGTVTLEPLEAGFRLKGRAAISNGFYNKKFDLNSRLYTTLRRAASRSPVELINDAAMPVYFDIDLYTDAPIRLENNVAKAEITANLKLTGSSRHPVLAGRAEIKTGGEIYLGKNVFIIERGTVNFINPSEIEPELDIDARTQVAGTVIQLRITGTPRAFSPVLTSTPSLPESHIIALLVSGKPMESTAPSTMNKVGGNALLYLADTLTGKVEDAVKRTLGLETVRLDGVLVAAKENPGARLTVGHHLTSNLEVILSQSLKQSQDRTWIVNYGPAAGVNLQAVRQDNNAYSLGLNHQLKFGLKTPGKTKSKTAKTKVAGIEITGNPGLTEQEIRKKLRVKKGKTFKFFGFRKDIDRIRRFYYKKNFLSARITSRKEETQGKTRLFLDIDAGPRVYLDFSGAEIPRRLRKKIRETWTKSQIPQQRLDSIIEQLHLYFLAKRYYKPVIRAETVTDTHREKRVVFHIAKGPRFEGLRLEYVGNHYTGSRRLSSLLKRSSFIPSLLIHPQAAGRFLESWYRQEGFYSVKAAVPEILRQGSDHPVTVRFHIDEGPVFKIGKTRFEGNRFLDDGTLAGAAGLREGERVTSGAADTAAASVEAFYAAKGYHNTRVMVSFHLHKSEPRVDFVFRIKEAPKRRIKDIRITHTAGNHLTKESAILREFTFKKGQILDLKAINKTRKKLYDTGLFKRVELEVTPPAGEGTDIKNPEQPCVVTVNVSERKPVLLKYGLHWDTESSGGIAARLEHANVNGRGFLLGTAFLVNKLQREIRVFARFPYVLGKKIKTELYLFSNRKKETTSAPLVERTGINLQQRFRLTAKSLLSVGYTFEKYRSEAVVDLGHLNASFTYDGRDNIFDASRGLFVSQSVQYAGKFLGSQVNFSRYLGKFNLYKPIVSRLVFGISFHVGLGTALGQKLLYGERFFAGGGSLRGFRHNGAGPLDPDTGEPLGGEALFLLRQELRWRFLPDMGVVFFLDMGNVYSRVRDFDPFDVRKGVGFGFRYRFSGLLLRLDWGFKLDRRPGESASHLFFSIGQSF